MPVNVASAALTLKFSTSTFSQARVVCHPKLALADPVSEVQKLAQSKYFQSDNSANNRPNIKNGTRLQGIGPVSGSRYMERLRATGADLGTGHKNNIRWMTVVTFD